MLPFVVRSQWCPSSVTATSLPEGLFFSNFFCHRKGKAIKAADPIPTVYDSRRAFTGATVVFFHRVYMREYVPTSEKRSSELVLAEVCKWANNKIWDKLGQRKFPEVCHRKQKRLQPLTNHDGSCEKSWDSTYEVHHSSGRQPWRGCTEHWFKEKSCGNQLWHVFRVFSRHFAGDHWANHDEERSQSEHDWDWFWIAPCCQLQINHCWCNESIIQTLKYQVNKILMKKRLAENTCFSSLMLIGFLFSLCSSSLPAVPSCRCTCAWSGVLSPVLLQVLLALKSVSPHLIADRSFWENCCFAISPNMEILVSNPCNAHTLWTGNQNHGKQLDLNSDKSIQET